MSKQMNGSTLRIKQAMEQAVASCKMQWESPDGSALFGNFQNAQIVGYVIGKTEWEALVMAIREAELADV